MKTVNVNSSTIESVSYDYDITVYMSTSQMAENMSMAMSAETYAKFLEADSKGHFLHESIVGKFGYARLK